MALFNTSTSPATVGLEGVHLYHFITSNCSQRVRIALEEKGIPWHDHHINLGVQEHLEDDFLALQPAGTVPALVHDGRLVGSSNEILHYLEEVFPEVSLGMGEGDEGVGLELMDLADSSQIHMGVETYAVLLRGKRVFGEERLDWMAGRHPNPGAVQMLRDYMEDGEAFAERRRRAREALGGAMGRLEERLGGVEWLSGGEYGVVDISWVVNFVRLGQVGFDLAPYERVVAWGERVVGRPAFVRAVSEYSIP